MKNFLPVVIFVFGMLSVYGQDKASNSPTSFRKAGFTNEKSRISIPKVSGDLKLDSVVYYTWDAFENRFMNNYRDVFSYDENDHRVLTVHSVWYYITGTWKIEYKVERSFDANGNKESETTYSWMEATSSWVKDLNTEYFQDQNGNDTLALTYHWDFVNNDWFLMTKRILDYSLSQKLYKETDLHKMTPESPWDSIFEYTIFQDEHELDTLCIMQGWDVETQQREFMGKQNIYYDMAGNDTLEVNYQYLPETSEWINYSKVTKNEDVIGNSSTSYTHVWETNPDKWEYDLKDVLVRDTVSHTEAEYEYTFHNDIWLESRLTNFYYSPFLVTGIGNTPETRNLVYPNPARGYIRVDSKNIEDPLFIEFYTTQGKKVLVQPIHGKDQISLDNLPEGMYIYKIIGKGTSSSGKLLVE